MPDVVQNNIVEPAQAITTVSYKNIKKVLKNIDDEFEVLKNAPGERSSRLIRKCLTAVY